MGGTVTKEWVMSGKVYLWRGEIKKTFKGGGEETCKGAKVNNFKGKGWSDWTRLTELMGFYINMYFKICSIKLKHVKESTNYYMNENDYDLKHAVDL